MKRTLFLLIAVAALAWPASADIIHYTDGRQLEGVIVARTADVLTVETSFGTIDVPLSKVASIEEKLTPRQELEQQRAGIANDDAPALFVLAQWAADQKLRKESRALMAEVLAADPDHEGANLALGRVQVDGRWFEPDEVQAYLDQVEAERRAQGLVLYEGEWIPEADANQRKGLVLYDGHWLPRREADTRGVLRDLAATVGWSTQATEGEFVTVFGDLGEETVEYLLHDLDAAVRDFLARAEPTEAERQRVVGREIPVYLVPDDKAATLLESGFLRRYPIVGDPLVEYGRLDVYGMNWPRAFLVLVEGPHLERNGDPDASRTGLLAHQFGRLFVDRFKGSRSSPGWVQVAFAAYYEGVVNYYSTVSISTEKVDDEGNASGRWVRGWEHFGEWRDQLRDEGAQRSLPSLRHLLRDPLSAFDSRGVGLAWSLLRFMLEKHRREFFDYLRAFDSNPFSVAEDLGVEHERAWAATFASTIDELESEWRDWALAQPPRFPNNELKR